MNGIWNHLADESRLVFRAGLLFPLLLVFAAAFFLGGCGSSKQMVVETHFHEFTPEEKATRDQISGSRYRLQPGDIFEVDFKFQDELDRKNILILPDGRFAISGSEDIKAAGLTVAELDSVLTAQFAKDYRSPDLAIIVQEMGKRFVFVLGEVDRPGSFELNQVNGGVLEAIALAGGFTENASTKEVLIIRPAPEGYFYRIANLSHLEKRDPVGLASLNIQANDLVYVPRSAMGDLTYFTGTFLESTLSISQLFWDIYAMNNLDKIDRLVR